MEKTLAERLLEERTKAHYALLKIKYAAYSFMTEKRALLDDSIKDEIYEQLNNIEWLWEDAESYLRHRTRMYLSGGREGRARTIGDAMGNYVEIQDLTEHEIRVIDFLSAMAPQDLERMNVNKLIRIYDRGLRGNPATKEEVQGW